MQRQAALQAHADEMAACAGAPAVAASAAIPSNHLAMQPGAHLSMSTVSATSRGVHSSCALVFSTPEAGPTVMDTVTNLAQCVRRV